MTIGLALKGKDHVVLASDTCRTVALEDGTYQDVARKLFRFNGTWAIGVAGALEIIQVIKNFGEGPIDGLPEKRLSQKIEHIRDLSFNAYKSLGGTERVWFLLAGFEKEEPFIYQWGFIKDNENNLMTYGPFNQERFSVIGAARHGALYFANEFHKDSWTVEQNLLMAFHCISEVAKHDVFVGHPIELVVVRERKPPDFVSENQLSRIKELSKQITEDLAERFSKYAGEVRYVVAEDAGDTAAEI
jgi:20S proteasome alpha/beta subunit